MSRREVQAHEVQTREVQAETNLLAAFVLMIGGAVGAGLPMALVIIWICS
jgi:hypothetical protein